MTAASIGGSTIAPIKGTFFQGGKGDAAELARTHGKKVFPVGKKLDQLDVNKHVLHILNP